MRRSLIFPFVAFLIGMPLTARRAMADFVSVTPAAIGQFHISPVLVTITTNHALLTARRNSPAQTVDRFGMEFSLASLPDFAVVTNATLKWRVEQADSSSDPIPLVAYTGDGVLSASDLNIPMSLVIPNVNEVDGGPLTANITGLVNAKLALGADYIGFLVGAPAKDATFYTIMTDQFFPGIGPTLQVTYSVPEASTLSLIALAALVTAVSNRRIRTKFIKK